jgi:hypothetical protein
MDLSLNHVDYSAIWEDSDSSSDPQPPPVTIDNPPDNSDWNIALDSLVSESNIMESLHHDDAVNTINYVAAKFKIINQAKREDWSSEKLQQTLTEVPLFKP